MIRFARGLRRLRDNVRGNTLVEFGFIALPMSLLILPPLDLGYRMYAQSVLQGVLVRAARASTTGTYTNNDIDQMVNRELTTFKNGATLTITRTAYQTFSGVGKPEKITNDTAPLGTYNVGDCYVDQNNNGQWDADGGKSGQGGADDVVYYKVVMTFPRIIPMMGLMGWGSTETIKSTALVKNQPYAASAVWVAPTRCI